MTRVLAPPRASRMGDEEMTSLEYAMAAAFVLVSVFVAVPAVPIALRSAVRTLLAPFA